MDYGRTSYTWLLTASPTWLRKDKLHMISLRRFQLKIIEKLWPTYRILSVILPTELLWNCSIWWGRKSCISPKNTSPNAYRMTGGNIYRVSQNKIGFRKISWTCFALLQMDIFKPKNEYLGPDSSGPLLGQPRMYSTSWDPTINPKRTSKSQDNLQMSNILKPILFWDTL